MIRFLSQQTTARKVVLWSFVIILVIGLAVVFATPNSDSFLGDFRPAPTDSAVVAEIGKYDITLGDLRAQIRSMGSTQAQGRTRPQDQPSAEALYPTYGKQALDSLINARVVRLEANNLGLGASQDEMKDRIIAMFSPGGRWMGTDAYERYLRDQGLTVQAFESDVADSIVEEKLRNFLTSAVSVSDREVQDDYQRANTTMRPTAVLVTPKANTASVPATDVELRAYFEANKDRFKITEPQRKITYLFIDQEAVGQTLGVSDEELRQEYTPEKFVSAVHAAEIVLRIPKPDSDPIVFQKAQVLADRARGTAERPAEDFAGLARTDSENPTTAAQGGDIGWIEKASVKPDDPRMRLFNLKAGQTTAPIKVDASYVIYKVLDVRSRSFEEARDELLTAARTRKGYSRSVEIASEAEEKLRALKDPQAAAQQINASLGAPADKPVVSVRETPYMQPGDRVPDVGQSPQFGDAIATLDTVGEVGSKVSVPGGLAVPMLSDKREPHDATFEEARDRVLVAYGEERTRNDVRAAAEQLATAASPDELMARARAAGYEPKTQENYRAGGALPGLPASDSVDSVLLQLPAGRVSPTPIELPTGFLVLAAGERKEPDMGEAFNQQRDSIRERLLATKKAQLYSAYIKTRVQQLKDTGEIAINQDVIDRTFIFGADFGDDIDTGVPTLPPAGAPRSPAQAPRQPATAPGLPPATPVPPAAPGR
jgi:peptidyl-prolyl cis-trans isomerase D